MLVWAQIYLAAGSPSIGMGVLLPSTYENTTHAVHGILTLPVFAASTVSAGWYYTGTTKRRGDWIGW